MSLHAYALPVNLCGCRYCPEESAQRPAEKRSVQRHLQRLSSLLRDTLTKQYWSRHFADIVETAAASATSKLGVLALRLQQPGQPLQFGLDMISIPCHRAALASFLCADWFMAKYAKNYFAKSLLPRTAAHTQTVQDLGIEPGVVCLACWHRRRTATLEDEFHVACVCPEYSKPRTDLLNQVSPNYNLDSSRGLLQLLSTSDVTTMEAVGTFLIRVRQTRRRLKNVFEQLDVKFSRKNFAAKRAAWRIKGKPACRHGVLFAHLAAEGCKCMDTSSTEEDWRHAKYMPALDDDLKCIIAVRFHQQSYKRLALLQADIRARQW